MKNLIVFVALVFISSFSAAVTDPKIDALESWISERPAHVVWVSQAEQDADKIFQTYHPSCYVNAEFWEGGKWFFNDFTICKDYYLTPMLDLLYGTPGRSSSIADEGAALLLVIHEGWHMHGNNDGRCNIYEGCTSPKEDKTECWAITHIRTTLNHLGISGQLQDELYAGALAHHYYMIQRNPIYYDPTCEVQ